MEELQPVFNKLKPIFEKIIKVLTGVILDVLEMVLPSLLDVLSALLPLFATLINVLLPPLLYVLGSLLRGIGELGKFILEMPERFLFHLPTSLGGKGGTNSDLTKIEQERLEEMKKQRNLLQMRRGGGPMGMESPLTDKEKKDLESLNKGIKKLGGTFKTSEELKGSLFHQAFGSLTEAGGTLQKEGKERWERLKKGEGTIDGEAIAKEVKNVANVIREEGFKSAKATDDKGTTKTTTEYTAAQLKAGSKGISVKERMKKTTTVEEQQNESLKKIEENTRKTAEETEVTNKELNKENAQYYFGRQKQQSKENAEKSENVGR